MLSFTITLSLTAQERPAPHAGPLNGFITQFVPMVIVGEGWSQRIILTDVDDTHPAAGTIQFYTKDGAPWSISTVSQGRASLFAFVLQPGQTYILETTVSQAPQSLGWAQIQEVSSGVGTMLGQTVFRKQSPGLPDFMCSMVLGMTAFTRMTAFFDNTGGNYTGMGILSSQKCIVNCTDLLRVTVFDLSGNVLSQKTISQSKGSLYWMNLAIDFPATANRMGTFAVEPVTKYTTTLTGFSLQFAGNGAFTVITPFEN